jgi:gluconolactonase
VTVLDSVTCYVDGLDHPEGVSVSADGIIWAGGEAGQVYRIDGIPPRAAEIGSSGGFTLGLALDGFGHVYTADPVNRCVQVFDGDGQCRQYANGSPGLTIRAPNHLCFDSRGNLYVSDSGRWKEHDGCIYRFKPGGFGEVWSTAAQTLPNGVCMGPGEEHLYIAMSLAPGRITRIRIEPDGSAGLAEDYVVMEGTVPDGLGFDERGNLYVATYRPDAIWVVAADTRTAEIYAHDPEGRVLAAPTNLAFTVTGPPMLLVANMGRWHLAAMAVDVPGMPLAYPAVEGLL